MSLSAGVSTFAAVTATTTVTTSGVATQASGSGIYLAYSFTATSTFSSIGDNKGNSYQRVGSEQTDVGGSLKSGVFYCPNAAGGSGHTATLTVTGSAGLLLSIVELKTTNGAGILVDQATQGTDDTSAYTSPNITTTIANEILTAYTGEDSSFSTVNHTAGNSFVLQVEDTDTAIWTGAVGTRVVSSTGTYNSSWTMTGTINHTNQHIASFSEVAGGVLPPSPAFRMRSPNRTPFKRRGIRASPGIVGRDDTNTANIPDEGQTANRSRFGWSPSRRPQMRRGRRASAAAPEIITSVILTPSTATLTLTAFSPTVLTPVVVTPDIASLTLTAFAPTVLTTVMVIPDLATLALTAFPPTVLTPVIVVPDIAALTLTAFAPSVIVGGGVVLTPDPASLILTAYPPLVSGGGTASMAGVVPIRYVVGETANVVPVETVTVWEPGVVSVREQVGPANVVPVREAPGETPRVKVLVV